MSNSFRALLFVFAAAGAVANSGCNWSGDVRVNSSARDMAVGFTDDMNIVEFDMSGGCGLNTCAQMNANCGPIGDGCGGTLNCGTCTLPQTCGGGGKPFQCGGKAGCIPLTCAQLGLSCGPSGDGCGGSLNCGGCPSGQTCGGGGVNGQCGQPNCTPKTCAQQGLNCGPAGDGCGGQIDCGTCTPPQTCGGGGTPGVCGGGGPR